MSETSRLRLPLLDAAQSQKHITHNEAIDALDVLVQLSVVSRQVLTPPANPADGVQVIVGNQPQNLFAPYARHVAAYRNGAWSFFAPRIGWRAFVENEHALFVFDGTDWTRLRMDITELQNLTSLGVGTSADAQNPVSLRANSILVTACPAGEGGSGDVRLTLNRELASDVVSQVYQSNYSGRAETGLMGDDRYRIKVSSDGASWKEALVVDPASGRVAFPNGLHDLSVAPATTGFNLLEDGGRFAGNPEPVSVAVSSFADVSWLTNMNGAVRVNYGLARPSATLHPNIADLLNKIRPSAAQAGGSEFFVVQVTAGSGIASPITVQNVTYAPPLSSSRHIGRAVTAGLYFRVVSGALCLAPTDALTRILIDGVSHDVWSDTPARVFTSAQGWKQMQMWQAPANGAVYNFWPMRVTPGTIFLIAAPFIVSGLQTFATDLGPLPSQRQWR